MIRVLEALTQLKPGETLLVAPIQRPMFPYSKPDEMGHRHRPWDLGPAHVDTIVLHPFAHLFGQLSRPALGVQVLQTVEEGLRDTGLAVTRTPFWLVQYA